MILIKNLSVAYGKKLVIDNLNMSMQSTQIHGIVGLNGAGKTTLLNTLYGIKKAKKGSIQWNKAKPDKKVMSYLPTEPYFYPNITGKEYLEIFPGKNFKREKWNALFKLPLNKLIDEYSTGMKKKLALLAVIKNDKPLIILDEPFNGIDFEATRILRSILLELKNQGKTIIITSHILETLTNLCDHLYFLAENNIQMHAERNSFKTFEQSLFQSIKEKNENDFNELFNHSAQD